MTRFGKIISGALVMGFSAAMPFIASADGFRGGAGGAGAGGRDRDDRRPVAANVRVQVRGDDHRWDDRGHSDWDRGGERFDRDRDRVVIDRRPVIVQRPVFVAPPPPVVVAPAPAPLCLPNVNTDVQLCDVPGNVLDTARHENPGGAIASIQFVRRDGHEFYRFMISSGAGGYGGYGGAPMWDLRVSTGGNLLGIDRS